MSDEPRVCFYRIEDADPHVLSGQSIAVVGYGNLGRPVALNLRDSGQRVAVGNVADDYRSAVETDGFEPRDIPDVTADADIVILALPDEVIPECFAAQVRPYLPPGSAVCFASGYALAYGLVDPPAGVDVLMLAPRMIGQEVRSAYEQGRGCFSYLSVEQDASGKAGERLLAVAHSVGALSRGALDLSAEREAHLDLYVEQTFGAYLGVALQTAFAVGREAGLPPEALVLELYMSGEMSRTLATFADQGFFAAVAQHGLAATYGGFLRTLEIDGEEMQRLFHAILDDISSGGFASRLQREQREGYPTLSAIRRVTDGNDSITEAERRVRAALSTVPDADPS